MIVVRLLIVALLVAVAAFGLAWLVTGNRLHLVRLGRLLRFAMVAVLVGALFYLVERVVLR